MTTTTDFEDELRQLYAEVTPPLASALHQRARVPSTSRLTRTPWRHAWAMRGLAIGACAAVVAVGTLAAHRGATGPQPAAGASGGSALLLTLQPAGASLGCTLPISALSADHTVGFVHLRGGHATFDPVQTSGTTYVRGLHRWITDLPQNVSPDGNAYFTVADHTQDLTVVSATGERALGVIHGGPMGWYGRNIVVLNNAVNVGTGPPSNTTTVSLVDMVTGTTRTLPGHVFTGDFNDFGPGGSSVGYVPASHSFWSVVNHADGSTTVDSFDLASQATQRWFQAPGFVQVVGADSSGHPILQNTDRDIFHVDPAQRAGITTRTLLLTAPNQPQVLNAGTVGRPNVADNLSPLSVTDGDSVWLVGDNGQIWRYTPATGMQLILKVTTSTRGAPGVAISGPCH